MSKKEKLEELKQKNSELEKTLLQPFQDRVKKINKYLSRYLYSLLGISITGSLLALAAFFTPWLPSVAAALTAVFTTLISALALPLLITISIFTVALVLTPIAAFLWRKHQVNFELNNSFEKLKKSLDSLEVLKINEAKFDDQDEYQAEKNKIKMRQALCIHEFLATEKVANYYKIDELLGKYGISAEWIYVVDLILKKRTIPDNQEDLDNRYGDQVDNANFEILGVDKFLLDKQLRLTILKNIQISNISKKEDITQQSVSVKKLATTTYDLFGNGPEVPNSQENSIPNSNASYKI